MKTEKLVFLYYVYNSSIIVSPYCTPFQIENMVWPKKIYQKAMYACMVLSNECIFTHIGISLFVENKTLETDQIHFFKLLVFRQIGILPWEAV